LFIFSAGLITETALTSIGDVINGNHPGRSSADEHTLFDGTGVGLQDLAAATASVRAAIEQNQVITIEL